LLQSIPNTASWTCVSDLIEGLFGLSLASEERKKQKTILEYTQKPDGNTDTCELSAQAHKRNTDPQKMNN